MNEQSAAIRCVGLSRNYGPVQALRNLNLEVPVGSVFGFLGRNGAGKTTTIRILTGLAHPSAGSAWVAGVETTQGDSAAREMFGYLPQDPAFYNWMTPVEYLDYVGSLFGLSPQQRRQRIEELLTMADLQGAARRTIGGFSGGMIQRLGIAQALIHNPPVLILDEPTSALDPAGRYEVLGMMEKLRGAATVFFSTHILSDVERICDMVAILHKGELVQVSRREDLLAQYPVNTLLMVRDIQQPPFTDAFIEQVRALPWVTQVNVEETSLRIVVRDISEAKRVMMPLVVEAGLQLDRYEWVRPTLEEIFLRVSAE